MEISSSFLVNSPLITFTLMFGAVYVLGRCLVLRNWGSSRCEATSCFVSLFHGSPAVIMGILGLIETRFELDYAAENTAFQDLVLEFSTAYFIIDLLHYLVFIPKDVLFIAHHLATLYVLVTCRFVVHRGGVGMIGLLVLAEVTSPCQNTWSLARYRKLDLPEAARYYEFLSPYFFTFYSVVRGVLGPLYVFKMGAFLAKSSTSLIPMWAWVSWLSVIVVAIWVSIMWIMNLWIGFFRRRANMIKKVSWDY